MAEELERLFGVKSQLIESGGGVFEIEYGKRLIFSKKSLGRFPGEGEVARLIEQSK